MGERFLAGTLCAAACSIHPVITLMMITVVIAEDHDIMRQGVGTLLADRFGARVVADTGDGLDVLPLVEAHAPDVLVLDLSMPGLNGLDVLRQVERRAPDTRTVVLSMHSEDAYVLEALSLGASGYVLKGACADELIEAVRAAVHGGTYLSHALPERLLESLNDASFQGSRYEILTDREREVLQLTAEGLTSREVGERLFISHRTVEKHRQNLMAKLELSNTAEIVQFALRRGLIPLAPPSRADAA
jgi:DNA-binding NarL/FixJ family response regulator